MKTFPLQSLTIIEAQQKQFALVDSICRHFPGSEFLTGGDLGLTPGLNQPRVTQRVEQVLADAFHAQAAALVGGLKRVVKKEHADGSITRSEYDEAGRLKAQTDAAGRRMYCPSRPVSLSAAHSPGHHSCTALSHRCARSPPSAFPSHHTPGCCEARPGTSLTSPAAGCYSHTAPSCRPAPSPLSPRPTPYATVLHLHILSRFLRRFSGERTAKP